MLMAVAGERAALAGFEIEQPDFGRGRAGVTRARPMEPITAIDDRLAVAGVGGIIHRRKILAEQLRAQRLYVDGEEAVVGAVAFGRKDELLAVRAPAKRAIGARMPRQLLGRTAVGRHGVDVIVAAALAGEGHPLAVGRELRVGVHLDVLRERRGPAGLVHAADPDVAAVDEGDSFPIRAEGRHARADDGLRRGGRELSVEGQIEAEEPEQDQPEYSGNGIHCGHGTLRSYKPYSGG